MPKKSELFNEGNLLYQNGEYKEAFSKFEQFLEDMSPVNNYLVVIKTHTKIGECLYHLQNFSDALKHFDTARSLAESKQDNYFLAMSQMNLAKVLLNDTTQQGSNLVQASYYLEEALQRFHQLQDNAGIELVNELQADLEVQQKKAELNIILSSLPINLTPNILLRSGSDLRSVFLETVRGEYQLDVPRLNAIIYLLQLIRDKLTLEGSPLGSTLKKIKLEKNFLKTFCKNAFSSNFTWIQGLKNVDDVNPSTENSLVVVGRKWGQSKTKGIPLGVLFEYSEGSLKLRGISETSSKDIDSLLPLILELFENKQNLWRSTIIISAKPRYKWRKICGGKEFNEKK